MELQFDKSEIRYLKNALRDIRTGELTQETKLSDGMPDIGRVLTSWGQIILRSKEWGRDEISVSGAVMVWTLYIPEDGTEVRSVESWVPFQMHYDVDPEQREGPIRIVPLIRFVDARGTSARKLMIRTGVSVMAQALSPDGAAVYQPGQVPEDVQLLTNAYPVRIPKEAGEKVFLIDEELAIPDANAPVDRLLASTLQTELTDKKVIGNKIVFKGNAHLHLVYRCAEGKVRTVNLPVPFSQYSELDGIYDDDAGSDIHIAVTNLEMDMMNPGRLRLKAGMVGQYLIDQHMLLNVTEDAYSPFREVDVKRQILQLPSILEDRRENVTAEQSLTGQTGQTVDVTFLPDFPRQRRDGQGLDVELPGLFQVLYYGEDGSLQAANSRWEGSTRLMADEDTDVELLVSPVGKATGSEGGEGIGITGQMQLQIRSTAETSIPMVSSLELGEVEEPNPARPSVVVCRMGDENLWDIAKRCGSTVGAIREANRLTGEPERENMLLVPVF